MGSIAKVGWWTGGGQRLRSIRQARRANGCANTLWEMTAREGRAPPPPEIVLITDPGPDPDDVKAILVAACQHAQGLVRLRAVVANGGSHPLSRARLVRCLLNHIGIKDVPVGVGSKGIPYVAQPHEFNIQGYSEVDDATLVNGHKLLLGILRKSVTRSLRIVCIASMRDLCDLMDEDIDLVVKKVHKVVIMGGLLVLEPGSEMSAGTATVIGSLQQRVSVLEPDTSMNNMFDIAAARQVYSTCFARGIPLMVVSRHTIPRLPMQLARSFAERTSCPVMGYLAEAQFLGLEGLWQKLCAGLLPGRCTKQWYFENFCGIDARSFASNNFQRLDSSTSIRSHLNGFVLPYDVVALMAAIPSTESLFNHFDDAVFLSNGVQHTVLLTTDHVISVGPVLRLLRDTYHFVVIQSRRRRACPVPNPTFVCIARASSGPQRALRRLLEGKIASGHASAGAGAGEEHSERAQCSPRVCTSSRGALSAEGVVAILGKAREEARRSQLEALHALLTLLCVAVVSLALASFVEMMKLYMGSRQMECSHVTFPLGAPAFAVARAGVSFLLLQTLHPSPVFISFNRAGAATHVFALYLDLGARCVGVTVSCNALATVGTALLAVASACFAPVLHAMQDASPELLATTRILLVCNMVLGSFFHALELLAWDAATQRHMRHGLILALAGDGLAVIISFLAMTDALRCRLHALLARHLKSPGAHAILPPLIGFGSLQPERSLTDLALDAESNSALAPLNNATLDAIEFEFRIASDAQVDTVPCFSERIDQWRAENAAKDHAERLDSRASSRRTSLGLAVQTVAAASASGSSSRRASYSHHAVVTSSSRRRSDGSIKTIKALSVDVGPDDKSAAVTARLASRRMSLELGTGPSVIDGNTSVDGRSRRRVSLRSHAEFDLAAAASPGRAPSVPFEVTRRAQADCFIVHSHDDDIVLKQVALAAWTENYTRLHGGAPPLVFLDAVSADPSLPLHRHIELLPFHLGLARRLLVLWGVTLLDQLVCVIHLVIWHALGRSIQDVDVVAVAAGEADRDAIISSVDAFHVAYATCSDIETRRRLTSAVMLANPARVNDIVTSFLPLVRDACSVARTPARDDARS